jgi:hypothetical protein
LKNFVAFAWVFFLAFFFYMAAFVLPAALAKLNEESSVQPPRIPDLQFYVHLDELNWAFIKPLTEKGRDIYVSIEMRQDVLYPISYAGFLFFSLLLMIKKLPLAKRGYFGVLAFPVFALLADVIENYSLVKIVTQFPKNQETAFFWYQVGFLTKWSAVIFSFVALIILLVIWLKQVYSLKPQG